MANTKRIAVEIELFTGAKVGVMTIVGEKNKQI